MFKTWLSDTYRLFFQAIGFSFFLAPKKLAAFSNFFSFIVIFFLSSMAFVFGDYYFAGDDPIFYSGAINAYAMMAIAFLTSGFLAAWLIRRKVLWLNIASTLAVCASIWTGIFLLCVTFFVPIPIDYGWKELCFSLFCLCTIKFLYRLSSPSKIQYAIASTLLAGIIFYWPWHQQLYSRMWYSSEPDPAFNDAPTFELFEAESIFAQQPALLESQLDTLLDERENKIDLYAVGVAADGHENVFRNEVLFLKQLLETRFDNKGRNISLINTFDSSQPKNLATAYNLQHTLASMASKMDKQNDILLLYITTHGSPDHQLSVQLSNLPMTQITPDQLNTFLNATKVQHQIIVISACYSGGFIEPLRNDKRLIITASSKDRTSFGCGATSEITWFGNAFWAMAMNNTQNFEEGFAMANKTVAAWEKKDQQTPSQPQISAGKTIHEHLKKWQLQLPKSTNKLVFKPTPVKLNTKAPPAAIDSSAHH